MVADRQPFLRDAALPADILTPAFLPARIARRWPRYVARLIIYAALLVFDMLAILVGFELAGSIRGDVYLSTGGVSLGVLMVPVYLILAVNRNAFAIETLRSMSENLRRPLTALLLAALLIVLFAFLTKSGLQISRLAFATATGISAVLLIAGRLGVDGFAVSILRHRLTDELLIVDGGDPPLPHAGYTVLDAGTAGLVPDLGNPAMLDRIAAVVRDYDRVIVSAPRDAQTAWSMVLKGTSVTGEILLREENRLGAIGVGEFGGHDTILVSRGPLNLANRIKKRLFDLSIAIPAIILLCPLMLVVALAIKLETPGPILFKQRRVGQSNGMFEIWKFRSMRVNDEGVDGAQSTTREDDRVTRVGRFIRSTSIDELPQFFNVLRGDMSIVGPRPHALGSMAGDQLFWEVSKSYWMRHALRPGITGLAQIRGFRGATHRREDLEQRLQADLEYVNGWRLSRDLTILVGTLRVLMHREAY
jgi:polysaccharide biosynthesis protein PslA